MKKEGYNIVRPIIDMDKGPLSMVLVLLDAGELIQADGVISQAADDNEMDWRELFWLHLKWEDDGE